MNPSTALARIVVDELVRAGVTDVVLAPGSRSAPLALALAAAEADGRLHLHVRIDERSAGYLAVGLAKVASRSPVAVVTTSGTAAVNLHPAVVEASYSGVGIVALTADRPPALRGTGANQTIDQSGLFGRDVRWSVELSSGENGEGHERYWRSVVARAVARCADAVDPGPVHLNVAFADPLVPDPDVAPDRDPSDGVAAGARATARSALGVPAAGEAVTVDAGDRTVDAPEPSSDGGGRPGGREWTADGRLLAGMAVPIETALSYSMGRGARLTGRGLIVVGDFDDDEGEELVDDLSDATGWPVLSEPSGNARGCGLALAHGSLLCGIDRFADEHVPDVVLTVGRVGLTRSVLRLVRRAALHIAVDGRPVDRLADPTRTADVVLPEIPLPPEDDIGVDEAWTTSWVEADAVASTLVATVLREQGRLTGPDVARAVWQAVPADGLLVAGPSWPVRLLDAFAESRSPTPLVVGNRGTSGIDGIVSTAWGAAARGQRPGASLREALGLGDDPEAAAEVFPDGVPDDVDLDAPRRMGPAVALLGDLSFLYDSNGLLAGPGEPRPDLTYVVIDNDGGGIFSSLEQGAPAYAQHFERVFGTPHGRELRAVARAFGVAAVEVTTRRRLAEELDARVRTGGGVSVVVAKVGPRAAEAALLRAVSDRIGHALAPRSDRQRKG